MVKFRRKKYWIDFGSQVPFILKICLVWAGGTLLLCGLLHYLADEELGRSFYSVHHRIRNTWQILLPAVLISGGVSFLLTIGATLFLALRQSHRLGGPIFKFNSLFSMLEKGSFATDFHFRTSDLLFNLGESYRSALQANRERILELQDLSVKTETSTQGLVAKFLLYPLTQEDRELLEGTAALVSRLRESTSSFDAGLT
jgi:hypothetical protein